MSTGVRRRGVALVVLLALATGCAQATVATEQPRGSVASGDPSPSAHARPSASVAPPTSGDPYLHLARALHSRNVTVWFEADLVKAWLAGPAAFHEDVVRLGQLAAAVPTAGFKIADELGYHDGLGSAAQAGRFLRDARRALAAVAPGRAILIDAVVLDLGCLPWDDAAGRACAEQADAAYPAASSAAMTGYLSAGLLDALDLSTGLLSESQYRARGRSLAGAQDEAWRQVATLGWPTMTRLQARKAMAAAGGYAGSARQAGDDVHVYVQVPLSLGALGVDIWTWRQPYDGQTVSLLGTGLRPNPLWTALLAQRRAGSSLFTHMTPSQMPTAPAAFGHECDVAASVFDAVFVAAGTG